MAGANSGLPEELVILKEKYTDKCRVIRDIGDFKYVVSIKRNNNDLSYKFQLTDIDKFPHIAISSTQLSEYDKSELISYLNAAVKTFPKAQVLDNLIKKADDWLKEQNLEYSLASEASADSKSYKKKKGKRGKVRQKQEEDVQSEKKASMKTADDVVKRIQWDGGLNSEDFTIGYLDRFIGVVEKTFEAFSWEDLASVDYDELAIPKHRIQYFKYKKEIVWDKNKRLDNVFGSTGSGKTIIDVIENYNEAKSLTQEDHFYDSLDDSDSDEEVVIKTGCDESEEKKEQVQNAEADSDGLYPREQYWGKKKRPTHFFCLRITNPQIRQAVQKVHDVISCMEPDFTQSFIPPERLHITLACVGLDTNEDVNKAAKALLHMQESLQEIDPLNIEIELDGTDNFFHNVLYAKVSENRKFLDFVELFHSLLLAEGIEIRDVFDFTPHMTLLKFKKSALKELKTRFTLDSRIYSVAEKEYFGKQNINNVHLCVMSEQCGSNGFYITPEKISFK